MIKLAILDDFQDVALSFADWDRIAADVELTVFQDHLADQGAVAERLKHFDAVLMIRERTPFPATLIEQLPNLKLLVTTGMQNASIDLVAAATHGVMVCGTRSVSHPTPELTWGLILSLSRHLPIETSNMRQGRWQTTIGTDLCGKVLGVVGLGRLGTPVAKIGLAFGMNVVAWSPNLTEERARAVGVHRMDKDGLFSQSDVITIHMPLSRRSRNLVGAVDLRRMKPTAFIINTSRGPIIDESGLLDALRRGAIAGAGLDVYGIEPLPADDPLRALENVVLTPHLGYVTEDNYRLNFADALENVEAWLAGTPVRVIELNSVRG